MERIIVHWTAGSYKASSLDRRHYHFLFEGDGTVVKGHYLIRDNQYPINTKKGYAAHTWKMNTNSIGLSMCCMADAKWPDYAGTYPMTRMQFEAMAKFTAMLCKKYEIPVTPKTVLSHAEVQPNLGKRQKGKWDFTIIPFKPELKGYKACGDYFRERVVYYLDHE